MCGSRYTAVATGENGKHCADWSEIKWVTVWSMCLLHRVRDNEVGDDFSSSAVPKFKGVGGGREGGSVLADIRRTCSNVNPTRQT